ncbi:MAG TPA: GntR family transcriptional regulator [Nocardioides sp.]|nr:GntR family transcriptional regulator [Nocardioides sp.]
MATTEPTLQLVAARRLSLRDEATDQLRAQIIAGTLAPDTLISIGTIAKQLEISATPVREAVLKLAQEGLVEVVKNRGFRVRVPTDKELDDIVELRLVLEVAAMRRVAELDPHPDLGELRPLAEDLVGLATEGDMARFVAVDKEFHLGLTALLGNPQYVEMVELLRNRSRLLGLPRLSGDRDLIQSASEHIELLELISAGDGPGSEALMRQHLRHVRGLWAGRPESQDR